jgi:hypothetical protein
MATTEPTFADRVAALTGRIVTIGDHIGYAEDFGLSSEEAEQYASTPEEIEELITAPGPEYRNENRLCPNCGQPVSSWYGGYSHDGAEENGTDCYLEGAVIPGGIADFAPGEFARAVAPSMFGDA